MSHFLTLVLVNATETPIEEQVAELLAPYDENMKVPEYKCAGDEGERLSTYNPKSKWDWWQAGGRYADMESDGFDSNTCTCLVSSIPPDFTPFAILTPNGEWHERGKMGWWATVADEKPHEEWAREVRAILGNHKDAIAVACDLHI